MKALIGLGNPGKGYDGTRHNVGFEVVDAVKRRVKSGVLQFVKPSTFMNRSGEAVKKLLDQGTAASEMLIVCDDMSLPLGRLRFRRKGSSGGHNGLQSVIDAAGDEVARLRIGIKPEAEVKDWPKFVLEKFDAQERPILDASILKAAEAVLYWTENGIDAAMNIYNSKEEQS